MTDTDLYTLGYIEARNQLTGFDLGTPAGLRRLAGLLDRHGEPYSQGAAAYIREHADELEAVEPVGASESD